VNPKAGTFVRTGAVGRFVKAPPPKLRDPEKEIDETARAITARFRAIRERKDAIFADLTDTDHYLVLCFQSDAQRTEWARKAGMPVKDQLLDGMELAERMKITLESPVPPRQKPFRPQDRWKSIALPVHPKQ
jgi:hypothetical protein